MNKTCKHAAIKIQFNAQRFCSHWKKFPQHTGKTNTMKKTNNYQKKKKNTETKKTGNKSLL